MNNSTLIHHCTRIWVVFCLWYLQTPKKGTQHTHIYTHVQTENISWTFQDITLGTKRCTWYTLRWFRNLKDSAVVLLGDSLKSYVVPYQSSRKEPLIIQQSLKENFILRVYIIQMIRSHLLSHILYITVHLHVL